MDYEPGTPVSERGVIQGRLGLDPRHVAASLSRLFCEMVFIHGWVHCDPHPGNVLVRAHPEHPARPQLILLDHGAAISTTDDRRPRHARSAHPRLPAMPARSCVPQRGCGVPCTAACSRPVPCCATHLSRVCGSVHALLPSVCVPCARADDAASLPWRAARAVPRRTGERPAAVLPAVERHRAGRRPGDQGSLRRLGRALGPDGEHQARGLAHADRGDAHSADLADHHRPRPLLPRLASPCGSPLEPCRGVNDDDDDDDDDDARRRAARKRGSVPSAPASLLPASALLVPLVLCGGLASIGTQPLRAPRPHAGISRASCKCCRAWIARCCCS
jgi:hypothetical protein